MESSFFVIAIATMMLLGGCLMNKTEEAPAEANAALRVATFAGGCFWCMQPPYAELDGVIDVTVGYIGGTSTNPTYEEVSSGTTGHAEAVQITYDPTKIAYTQLLDVYWRQIDPTDDGGQFADRGSQYRSAIFYHDEEQRRLAEESRDALDASGRFAKPVVTEIVAATAFYPAEECHDEYYKKYPLQYQLYKKGSGREGYLKGIWNTNATGTAVDRRTPLSNEELKKTLTPIQYQVTCENGTERAFDNAYWDNHAEGIYVDLITGEPLFSSADKYDSGTGWPSFTQPIAQDAVVTKEDESLFLTRTEVRSASSDAHLGHVFDDGPGPTGQRYCMNSAALRFVAKADLEKEGYGAYRVLFIRNT